MSTPHSSPAESSNNDQPYSQIAAEHIRQLAGINQRTPELLTHAAHALSLLTNTPVASALPSSSEATARAETIRTTSHDLFLLINKFKSALQFEVNALVEAGVIPNKIPTTHTTGTAASSQRKMDSEAHVTNGGFGNFSIAELNARAGVRQQGDEGVLDRLEAILGELAKRAKDAEGKGDEDTGVEG